MKFTDYEEVKHLINTLTKVTDAYTASRSYELNDGPDTGGVPGAEIGYYGTFSKHEDGSGDRVDLNGCYVEHEVVTAISNILDTKRHEIMTRLRELGVEI